MHINDDGAPVNVENLHLFCENRLHCMPKISLHNTFTNIAASSSLPPVPPAKHYLTTSSLEQYFTSAFGLTAEMCHVPSAKHLAFPQGQRMRPQPSRHASHNIDGWVHRATAARKAQRVLAVGCDSLSCAKSASKRAATIVGIAVEHSPANCDCHCLSVS